MIVRVRGVQPLLSPLLSEISLGELNGTGQPAVGQRERHRNKPKVEAEHGHAHC